jgi:hypothetical protein
VPAVSRAGTKEAGEGRPLDDAWLERRQLLAMLPSFTS